MIYGIKATPLGTRTIEQYAVDSEDAEITFVQAIVLAKANAGFTVMRELVHTLVEDFPFEVKPDFISATCLQLEKKGLLEVVREVTVDTKVVVRHTTREGEVSRIETTLHNFRFSSMPSGYHILPNYVEMAQRLQERGVLIYTFPYRPVAIEIKVA